MAKRGRPPKNKNLQNTTNTSGIPQPNNVPQPTKRGLGRGPRGPHHWIPNPTGKGGDTSLYSEEELITAIREAHGFIYRAAELLGCTPQTIYHRIKKNPKIAEEVRLRRRIMRDIAEFKVYEHLNNDADPEIQSRTATWYLSRMDKAYRKDAIRPDVNINNQINVNQGISSLEQMVTDLDIPVETLRKIKEKLQQTNGTASVPLLTNQVKDKDYSKDCVHLLPDIEDTDLPPMDPEEVIIDSILKEAKEEKIKNE